MRSLAFLLLATLAASQTAVTNPYGAPAPGVTSMTYSVPAATPAVVVNGMMIVGTYDGKLLFRNLSMTTGGGTSQPADKWLSVSTVGSVVTSLWMQSATTVGFICNDTVGVVTAATATAVWTRTVWGTFDIQVMNTYGAVGSTNPTKWGDNFYVGTQNWTTTMNSTIYAFSSTGMVWSQSVAGSWSNYQMAGNATAQVLLARVSTVYTSSIFGFDSLTGTPSSFVQTATSNYNYNGLMAYYMGSVYAVLDSSFYAFDYASGNLSYTLSVGTCSSYSSPMETPMAFVNGTLYFTCFSTVYAIELSTGTRTSIGSPGSYSFSAVTWDPTMSTLLCGDRNGRIYAFNAATNTFATTRYFDGYTALGSNSVPVRGFTWNMSTLIVSIGNTIWSTTYGYSYYQGRVFGIDYASGMVSFVFGAGVNPIGAVFPYSTPLGTAFAIGNNYQPYGSSVPYQVATSFLAGAGQGWSTDNSAMTYSAQQGAIYVNATLGLLITFDYYDYLYGWNTTTGAMLFQSSSNCDISPSYGFVQTGDYVCFTSGSYIRCFNYVTALASPTTSQSCVSGSYYSRYGNLVSAWGTVVVATTSGVSVVNPTTGNFGTTYGTSARFTPAVTSTMLFSVTGYRQLSGYLRTTTATATASWTVDTTTAPIGSVMYYVYWYTNAVVLGTGVYIVGSTTTTGTTTTSKLTLYCFLQVGGTSCGKTLLPLTSAQYLMASNGALFVFDTYNFTAVAPMGGDAYYMSNVSIGVDSISTSYANTAPMVSESGILTLMTTYSIYAFNAYTGGLLWVAPVSTSSSINGPMTMNNVVYYGSGTSVIAVNGYNGALLATFGVGQGTSSSLYGFAIDNKRVYGMYAYSVFGTATPSFLNVTGTLPGGFSPDSWLTPEEKKKLWIIAVVLGIVVVAVIVLLATRKSGGTGQKDTDYVAMNNAGNRV